jgi:hypothetical protein
VDIMERHFTVQELAEAWKFSTDFVMDHFRDEPGVLRIASPRRRGKRGYASIRIPSSVAERVYRRLLVQ